MTGTSVNTPEAPPLNQFITGLGQRTNRGASPRKAAMWAELGRPPIRLAEAVNID